MRHMLRTTRQARDAGPLVQREQPQLAPAPTPEDKPQAAASLPSQPTDLATPSPVDNERDKVQVDERVEAPIQEPSAPSAPPHAPTEAPADPPSETVAASQIYSELVAVVQRVFEAAQNGSTLETEALGEILQQVYRSFAQDDQLLTEAIRQRTINTPRTQRVANTLLLATRLGLEIDYDESALRKLGQCTFTHDIGMLTIPAEVFDSPTLSAEQLGLLRDHPNKSREMVEALGAELAWTGDVIAQVHERHDGSGYPQGLRGNEIHEYARIIGLADMYEALGHPRSDRKAHVIYNALTTIIDTRNKHFDPRLIKALINIVSIFPLGSLVKLNNNQIGRVVGANKLYPTRPLVETLLDHRGKHVQHTQLIHLEEEPMLYIVDPAIDEAVLLEK